MDSNESLADPKPFKTPLTDSIKNKCLGHSVLIYFDQTEDRLQDIAGLLGVVPRACDLLCPMGDFWDTLLQCLFGARMSLQSISKICHSVLRKQSEAFATCAFQHLPTHCPHIFRIFRTPSNKHSNPICHKRHFHSKPSFLRIFLNTSLVQRWRLRHALGTHFNCLANRKEDVFLWVMSPTVDISGHILSRFILSMDWFKGTFTGKPHI